MKHHLFSYFRSNGPFMIHGSFVARGLAGAAAVATIAFASNAHAVEPTGYLDSAGCEAVVGWSQDPDEPAKPIDVHLYFGGPAGSGAVSVATNAGNYRQDLCDAIGSCEHGFSMMSPYSFHDGVARDVYAYGIDSQGGSNPQLGSSPRTHSCPAAASGVKRRVDGVPSLEAWKFDAFWDQMPLGPAEANALTEAPLLPLEPVLVQFEGDAETVWLLDGGVRRVVPPEAVIPWRFELSAVEVRSASEMADYVEGTALRLRPLIFIQDGLYVVDDPQPLAPDPEGSGGGGGVGGGSGDGGGESEGGASSSDGGSGGGCAIAMASSGNRHRFGWLAAAVALSAMALRRVAASSRRGA
ncbi:MAG: hypothetical protein HOW73_16770 [Polyangiaceae bacterium]|nr:hypothetical protein [Polyangiaceae bacterium]